MPTLTQRLAADLAKGAALPPLPTVAMRLIATLGRDDVYMEDIAEIILDDPVIAGQVLRAANSAALGARVHVDTIREALPRLGLLHIRKLALVASARRALPVPTSVFPHEQYWSHSLAVAHAADVIVARLSHRPEEIDPEVVFLAGLLHDIGLLLLACLYPDEYTSVVRLAASLKTSFYRAEKLQLDTDHGELGAALARHWRLPEPIVAAVQWHHRPRYTETRYRLTARIVHLADYLCARVVGEFPSDAVETLDHSTSETLAVESKAISEILGEIRAEARRAAFMWLAEAAESQPR